MYFNTEQKHKSIYIIIKILCFFGQSFAEADIKKKHFTANLQYCNKQSTLYEQVDTFETERTEENQATKKQNLT